MPFQSKSQQRFMFAKHPRIAERWADETPNIRKLPEKKKMKKKASEIAQGVLRKISKDLIPGGMASGKTDADYNKRQIQMGAEVEKEHTPDTAKAHEIARDHLEEFPTYYTALGKMENQLKKQEKSGACATPGMKIRSEGKGRGLAQGQGKGPLRKNKSEIADLAIKRGAVLTEAKREDLPAKEFALPGERYPIHDLAHARNALARVSQHGTPEERKIVRQKVYAKYPELKKHFEEREGESPTSKENLKKEKLAAAVAEHILRRHAQ